MRLHSFHIKNFRRLKDVHIRLDSQTTVFVGPNNGGKTSATQAFQFFLGTSHERFCVCDFSADCWDLFDAIGGSDERSAEPLPAIALDLWFEIAEDDVHRVIRLLPGLDWKDAPVGVRIEFAPKDQATLLKTFRELKGKAEAARTDHKGFHPWPKGLTDYLKKRLNDEYKLHYYVLDHAAFGTAFKEPRGYAPQELGDGVETGPKILRSLLRVDFLHAQRYLSDAEAKGRAEDLSKRLNRFYERNLSKYEGDYAAVEALANSEAQLNAHLATVFAPTLADLKKLGYPGFADPHLVIKSEFDPKTIIAGNACVHYALCEPGKPVGADTPTLPDRYNGLGFKNLIYMVIELLDFHQRWAEEEERPPLHLVLIEEPEAHLHVQLQQVFIRKFVDLLPQEAPLFCTQMVVTTHSPHIIYESGFLPIRYFRRAPGHRSDVLDLATFDESVGEARAFLIQYMKLTHCDLFFADAAILVEGNVERLLLPLMIEKAARELKSSYLSVLELGGAFAHRFKKLIHFLDLTTLVITDLDSVQPRKKKALAASTADGGEPRDSTRDICEGTTSTGGPADGAGDSSEPVGDDDESDAEGEAGVCMASVPGAVTSNQTLIGWLPRLKTISELLSASAEAKTHSSTKEEPARVCVTYQCEQPVTWRAETSRWAGRTFEEAFAFENLAWSQEPSRRSLHLRVVKKSSVMTLEEVVRAVHDKVHRKSFDKTEFALALMAHPTEQWVVPKYIDDGLQWLKAQLAATAAPLPAPVHAIATEPVDDKTN